MDILQDIIATKREELAALCARKPSLRQALLDSPSGIIAEFKRRSPSKGWIKEDGRADIIPLSYQQNGAAALSILTDAKYFGGADDFIRTARRSGVTVPVLYKNFVIDEAQLYAAALYWVWKCSSRCTPRRNSNTPTCSPTSAASTTAIWVPSSPMWKTVSVWPNSCPGMLSR